MPKITPLADDDDVIPLDQGGGGGPKITPLGDDEEVLPVSAAGPAKRPNDGLVANYGAGANDLIARAVGAPVDAVAHILRQPFEEPLPADYRERHPTAAAFNDTIRDALSHPIGGSESVKRLMEIAGVNPDKIQAQTEGERAARAAGAGTAGMIPFVRGAGGVGAAATTGAVSGAAGQVAEDAAPDPWKPLANVVGQLVGGVTGAGVVEAGRSLYGAIADRLSAIASPYTAAGRERLAGQRITAAASNPEQARARLANGAADELVPGSAPTTYQATGDQGLGNLERASATQAPERFLERRAQQNQARVGAIEGLADEEANPAAVGSYFRRQLDTLDQAGTAVVNAARSHAEDVMGRMGGDRAPAEYGATAREAVAENYRPQFEGADQAIAEAQQRARGAAEGMGGAEFAGPGEDGASVLQRYGENLRGILSGADAAAKGRESGLWKAIDPDGTMVVGTAPMRRMAGETQAEMSRLAEPMDAREAAIFDAAAKLEPTERFQDVAAFRSRLTDAMRAELWENGKSQAYRRMTKLLDGIHDALESGVDLKAQQETQAVARGEIRPEDTMMQRLAAEAQQRYSGQNVRAPAEINALATGRATGTDSAAIPTAGPRLAVGRNGEGVPPEGRPGVPPGGEGVPGAAPVFDEAAGQRYAAARQATRERVETFGEGSVGKVLAPGQRKGEYKLPDSQVAARFFNSGKSAAEDIQGFVAAAGGNKEATDLLKDYAAFDLRRAAQRPDGTLDVIKYRRWIDTHGEALAAFPELRDRFGSAAAARQQLEDLQAQRAALEKAYPIRPGGADADVMPRYWRSGDGGAEGVKDYLTHTGGGQQAVDNLTDYAAHSLRTAAERNGTIDPKLYQTWARRFDGALKQLPTEVRDRFSSAAAAQETVERTTANRAQALRGYENSAAGHFLGTEPVKAVQSALSSDNPQQTFAELVRMTAGDAPASEGLRRAVVDFIKQRALSNAEGGDTGVPLIKGDVFQTLVKRNAAAFRELFSPAQMAAMKKVAADLQRSNRSIVGTKLPGGSNTPQDIAAAARYGGKPTVLGNVLDAVGGAIGAAAGHGAESLMLGYFATKGARAAVSAMRSAGMSRVDDLVTEAMLHPEIAETLMAKTASIENRPDLMSRLARQIGNVTRSTVAQHGVPSPFVPKQMPGKRADDDRPQQAMGRARGGRVEAAAKAADREPTEAQVKAGNFRHGHIRLHGLDFTIENAKGSMRRGTGPNGRPWQVRMPSAYGYVKRTEGADGEHVDAYLGPHTRSNRAFIVDQRDAATGTFDEHKLLIGFRDMDEALATYRRAFSDGRGGERIGNVRALSIADLKHWLALGDTSKPVARQ
jgi:Inorganic Pyrophosphatase